MKKVKSKIFTIEKKISMIITITVVMAVTIVGGVSAIMGYSSTINALYTALDETAAIAADRVFAVLKEYRAIAYETGSIARLANAENSLESKRSIMDQRVRDHSLSGAMILDLTGRDIFTGENLSDTECYKAAMRGETHVSTPLRNSEGRLEMMVSAPLWENGLPDTSVVGTIIFIPYEEFLNDIMRSISVGNDGNAFIVSSTGLTIADYDSSLAGVENLIEEGKTDPSLAAYGEIVSRMTLLENGYGISSYNGVTEVVSYAPIQDTEGWSIAICAIRSEFLTQFYISLIVIVVLAALAALAGVFIGRVSGKKIAAPIVLCVERLTALSKGDVHSDVPKPTQNDETSILLGGLEDTVTNLSEVINDIDFNLAEMSDGNLTVDVEKTYIGDFAQISSSVKNIVNSFNDTLRGINENADHVTQSSRDLASAAQSLADGATDQASAIEELTASIENVSHKVTANAEYAESARGNVQTMNQYLTESDKYMNRLTKSMENIEEASNQIANIIKTIESIASQTNLLSLNASIEAARAGDAGRGFAVVADEIRKLAEESSAAAQNTTKLIGNAISAIREGTELTDQTAESLNAAVGKAQEIHDMVDAISKASAEQSEATQQISQGVSQIAGVVETNSAMAEESSASSEELSSQATILKSMLEKFKYK